jgi:glycosidase
MIMKEHDFPPAFEFHISRRSRDLYRFDESLFAFNGNVIFANFHAARVFARKMNEKRDLVRFPEKAVRAGQINAMGLIDEILHLVVQLYREQVDPEIVSRAERRLEDTLGAAALDRALERFTELFPPRSVYGRGIAAADHLADRTGPLSNRTIALEEMMLLWLANVNPAFSPYAELFDHAELEKDTAYSQILSCLHAFFGEQPAFGPYDQNLMDMLRSPAVAVPYSLPGQLEYMRTHWGLLLGDILMRILGSLDFLQEEEKAAILAAAGPGGGGPGPSHVADFSRLGHEPEHYSPDTEWMPRLVLLAKNAHVWLDQISRQYGRPVTRLDEVPDEELDTLASRGFTGLWLIGLWERSRASRKIKQLCGNPEALASAYSLYHYSIAEDLGGEAAFLNLKERAWRRGIRMASDLVPNHMSIDSRWVVENPDWFLSMDYSPFPSYSFSGPDLSEDGRVGVFIEDHYYSREDAAVVFKRVDRWTGGERYIYHGNDGTSMPWNDTAQLNYLRRDAREAVIETILHVARLFPIIRFDAAMTLAKKHFQRLWFPEPGSGGGIPSRAEFGMPREKFDSEMPQEFWREVVDRVASEVPDTLLLAEAFWLMEGYFVRTLGMHRVYNSAFMNMLRDEENAKYRAAIRNTLEFDPEILKRYVNFMNNPDERTAVDQFGKGDKYFGICVLMSTLPGLPMFGHGQVEGYTEKYGMEYRKSYWDEKPDDALIGRHGREIFPLLHRRSLFAGVEHFLLYDFTASDGGVCEDVFAYSNRDGRDRALVVYHNRYGHVRGWVRNSVPYKSGRSGHAGRRLSRKHLAEGLGISNHENRFCIFRDGSAGLEYIRSSSEIWDRGLFFELNAYQSHVFTDFREVEDGEGAPYRELAALLEGRGVPSVDMEMRLLFIRPVIEAFESMLDPEIMKRMLQVRMSRKGVLSDAALLPEVHRRLKRLLHCIGEKAHAPADAEALSSEIMKRVEAVLRLKAGGNRMAVEGTGGTSAAAARIKRHLDSDPRRFCILAAWSFVHRLGRMREGDAWPELSRSWLDEWRFAETIARNLTCLGESEADAWKSVAETKVLTLHQLWFDKPGKKRPAGSVLDGLLRDETVRQFLRFNRFQETLWFNKEAFEELMDWLLSVAAVEIMSSVPASKASAAINEAFFLIRKLDDAMARSGYRVEDLVEIAGEEKPAFRPQVKKSPRLSAAVSVKKPARKSGKSEKPVKSAPDRRGKPKPSKVSRKAEKPASGRGKKGGRSKKAKPAVKLSGKRQTPSRKK